MHEAYCIMHRIAANNINAREHVSNSHRLNPIRHLRSELEKESYPSLEWKLYTAERGVVRGWIPFPG